MSVTDPNTSTWSLEQWNVQLLDNAKRCRDSENQAPLPDDFECFLWDSWSLDDFELGALLGTGQFGTVFLAREKRTGVPVALKSIDKAYLLGNFNHNLLHREIDIHSNLLHPNILQFYGWFFTRDFIVLIMEPCTRGELMDWVGQPLPEEQVSSFMLQMINAIECCHINNVLHRDLKPENILIDSEGNLKLADFGWAAHCTGLQEALEANCPPEKLRRARRRTYCGTFDYLSPEIINDEWYGPEVDVWCLGILCFELACGHPPFVTAEGGTREQHKLNIQKNPVDKEFPLKVSSDLRDFITRILKKDPRERPTLTQMRSHRFITKHNNIGDGPFPQHYTKTEMPFKLIPYKDMPSSLMTSNV
ncbi:MAG: hypothetical protein KVP17_001519 [Porospora cf. gigantea B]|uniref:uncharacterized protein n=1 Tax=Porospora cf. gigantea B TaxID=2853592 RepID=UPI0035719E53|nr:MAG: hypothetical protein KVP17_001519 [Porospora cf. gigantea B]